MGGRVGRANAPDRPPPIYHAAPPERSGGAVCFWPTGGDAAYRATTARTDRTAPPASTRTT